MLVQLSDRRCSTQATVEGQSIRLDWTTFFCLYFNHDTTLCVVRTQNMPLFKATACTAPIGHMQPLWLLFVTCYNQLLAYLRSVQGHTVPALSYDPFILSLSCWQWHNFNQSFALIKVSCPCLVQRNSLWLHALNAAFMSISDIWCHVCCMFRTRCFFFLSKTSRALRCWTF